ncbi:haloacid dehalogenase type II [Mycobacterium kubicae]|uniref:haloacid dehalogenase type II n=1 Tax=Mycobacterium kubicae TaxID=120959 RepID=UPI0007FEDBFD|nr:haloacid dehalogenase type II [Mycobacterium kubicae]OBK45170.1 haloacid dehalogenase, type II [Mycobacterium kubicae]
MPPSVLVFDVNETLIDIDSLTPLFADLFGDQRVLREWFNQLIMYSMAITLSDNYVDLFTLGQAVLRMLGDTHRVAISDDDTERLTTLLHTMPAHTDAAEALATLRDNGFRMVTLTNSPRIPGSPTSLENAGLAHFFEQQLSVDSCHAFKPAPAVYRQVCDALDVAPADCMMVAAHAWDLLGAQHVGLRSALVARPGNAVLPADGLPRPDVVVTDLRALARHLNGVGD